MEICKASKLDVRYIKASKDIFNCFSGFLLGLTLKKKKINIGIFLEHWLTSNPPLTTLKRILSPY